MRREREKCYRENNGREAKAAVLSSGLIKLLIVILISIHAGKQTICHVTHRYFYCHEPSSDFKTKHTHTRPTTTTGWIGSAGGVHTNYGLQDYLDLFDCAAADILNSSGHIITGEASASTMWDNNAWLYYHDSSTEAEPPFLIQDFIHALQPDARFIIILRDPVERLYSDYLYFGVADKSSDDFHVKVSESLMMFDGCLQHNSLRSCVYNHTLNNAISVRLQDHAVNSTHSMHRIFSFLQLGPISEEREREIISCPTSNSRRPSDRILGPMRPVTRQLLHDFYSPFNQKLSEVLQDESFLWSRSSS